MAIASTGDVSLGIQVGDPKLVIWPILHCPVSIWPGPVQAPSREIGSHGQRRAASLAKFPPCGVWHIRCGPGLCASTGRIFRLERFAVAVAALASCSVQVSSAATRLPLPLARPLPPRCRQHSSLCTSRLARRRWQSGRDRKAFLITHLPQPILIWYKS